MKACQMRTNSGIYTSRRLLKFKGRQLLRLFRDFRNEGQLSKGNGPLQERYGRSTCRICMRSLLSMVMAAATGLAETDHPASYDGLT
ncbi:hypothetical protein TNIN_300941 [Trichonephila inaurata madagascariensis]|uniref:Uncharacterized protein n=1 Tax=Trichonephila inaurata madagascariensis TaxID=2747483 RepID=A0A8X6YJW2_9ARAC|nr:hypothetical protein TNIN_300941 [Trichonephila inaurata madagascariensis]